MTSQEPLFIVLGTIAALMVMQYLLNRSSAPVSGQSADAPTPDLTSANARLCPGLSITGLDQRGISRLRELIGAGNLADLTTFLAFNRCAVPELDRYLDHIKRKLHESRPQGSGKISKITLKTLFDDSLFQTSPAGIRFEILDDDDRLHILSYEPTGPRYITREFMARFGGHLFQSTFAEYCQQKKPVTLNIPADDPKRPLYERLAETGVAEKGRDIALPKRLGLLTMKQLHHMAKDLNLNQKFKNKAEAIDALAQIPGARVMFSMQYIVDDLFHLLPLNEDETLIQEEWGYLTAYAKLLLSIPPDSLANPA
jgi:hypothetical protein